MRNQEISSRLWPCGCARHGDLYANLAQASDALHSVSVDRGLPLLVEGELAEGRDCDQQVLDDDAYVIHSLNSHTVIYLLALSGPAPTSSARWMRELSR